MIVATDRWGDTYDVKVSRIDYPRLRKYKWTICRRGYAVRKTSVRVPGKKLPKGLNIPMHREILGLAVGDPDVGNHKNRDRLDNRRSNLERTTFLGNMHHWMQQDGRMA